MTNESVLLLEFVTTPEKCGGFFTHTECEDFIKRNKIPENPEWAEPPSEECPEGIRLSAAMYIPVGTYAFALWNKLRQSESLMRAFTEEPIAYVRSTVNTEYPDGRSAPEEWLKSCVATIYNLLELPPEEIRRLTVDELEKELSE